MVRESAGERLYLWILRMEAVMLNAAKTKHTPLINDLSQMPIHYDFSMTNLEKIDWPRHFGNDEVLALYDPAVNPSVQEKTVGVITSGRQMTFTCCGKEMIE